MPNVRWEVDATPRFFSIDNSDSGLEVPIPTRPTESITKAVGVAFCKDADVVATAKSGNALVLLPWMDKNAHGEEEPTPVNPWELTTNLVELALLNFTKLPVNTGGLNVGDDVGAAMLRNIPVPSNVPVPCERVSIWKVLPTVLAEEVLNPRSIDTGPCE